MRGYIASSAIISLIVLTASTVSTSTIRVWPVSKSIAPWMFRRCRPLVCATAIRGIFRCPAANRPHRMGRMHRVSKDHRFIGLKLVQQIFIRRDKRRLLLRVELARHRFRLAMLHAKAVQQRDQAGPTLIRDAAFLLDPGADLARRPWQCLAESILSASPAALQLRRQAPPS